MTPGRRLSIFVTLNRRLATHLLVLSTADGVKGLLGFHSNVHGSHKAVHNQKLKRRRLLFEWNGGLG